MSSEQSELHKALQRARDALQLAVFDLGRDGANHNLKHPFRATWEALHREVHAADAALHHEAGRLLAIAPAGAKRAGGRS